MITFETFSRIINLYRQHHLTIPQIARELALDERTVAGWVEQGVYRQKKTAKCSSKLDLYKHQIVRWLESHPYTAVQIFQRLKEDGYSGGYTIVKDYIRKVRPVRAKAFLTLSFEPGECAQADWGSFGTVRVGSTRRKLSFFVMVLCYSRMMYVEFTVSQTMEHFLGCHQNAFEFFGGVPSKVMLDNMKSVVLKRLVGQAPIFNARYLDFSNHYGFKIVPCGVGQPHEKGQAENGVGYVKKNFLSGLEIPEFSVLNPAGRRWLETVVNVRIHGETHKKPVEMFKKEEPFLKSLSPMPYDIGVIRQVRASNRFRVSLDSNRYSVPFKYAGARLTLKAYPYRLCIYHDEKLIAQHVRSYDHHRDFEDPDHVCELLQERRKAREQKIIMRFLSLSPKAEAYYQHMKLRRMNPQHHVRKIIALSEIYGKEKVARAIEDAFTFHAFSSEYIANILEQRQHQLPEPGALHLTNRKDLLEIDIPAPNLSIYDDNKYPDKRKGDINEKQREGS